MSAVLEAAAPVDDMALPAGKSCADCRSFARCRSFLGAKNVHDKQTRCDWSPSHFHPRDIPAAVVVDTRVQIGPTDV